MDDSIEARFKSFCKGKLAMDDKDLEEAMRVFDKSKHLFLTNASSLGSGTPEEAEHYWFAFLLFSLKRLSQKDVGGEAANTKDNGFNLCQILRVAKLNYVDFFKELPQFIVKTGPVLSDLYGSDWKTRLQATELQANFVHLSFLSKYYKRHFGVFFIASRVNVDGQPADVNSSDYISNCYRFGWLLFLALRAHAFSRFKDLVTCTNGLVSILAILIIHVPARFRNFSLDDSSRFVIKDGKGMDLLASLCKIFETSEDELRKTLVKTNNVVAETLKKKPCLASECKKGNLENIDADGLTYFEDLLEESSLPSNLNILEKDYNDAILLEGELDEKLFINDDESLLGSSSLSGGAMNITGTKRKLDSMASPTKTITSPLSPYRSPSKIMGSPVSTAMTTAKWLRTIVSPLQSKPSVELERFLSSCDKDVTADVVKRARIILEAIFPNSGLGDRNVMTSTQMDNVWAEQRRLEALKLYYRVLQAMCTAESQILHGNNLTSLLTNERFHRCMLACSAELVLATHKTVTMLFPAVLERTGITAFDLSKVIESFIRHEESLPRELRRHLNSLEERLLENAIAMQTNMSCGGLPPVPSLQKRDSSPGKNGDLRSPKRVCSEYRSVLVERNSFASPVKDRLMGINNLKSKLLSPALQSAFASPTRPHPSGRGETCAETAVNLFFSKIVKLAAVRINGMVERMQLSQQIRERVYMFFQQILSQRTALFFNRHIDQIILCCFYGVAKISQLNLTFKEIIHNYRKQPHCKPQVFRAVFVGKPGQDHVDIIMFYNQVFIPAVKPLLMELAPTGVAKTPNKVSEANNNDEGPCPGSPKVSTFPSLPDMSPKKVSSVHNVYVSPLRSTKMDALITHGSKSYYACVGESTHAYQSPSKDLTAINNRLNGTRKVRGTLNFDEVDVGLVSDSLVASSLYLQNGKAPSSSSVPGSPEYLHTGNTRACLASSVTLGPSFGVGVSREVYLMMTSWTVDLALAVQLMSGVWSVQSWRDSRVSLSGGASGLGLWDEDNTCWAESLLVSPSGYVRSLSGHVYLHPRLPPPGLTMNNLLSRYIGIYLEQLDQEGLQIPFSIFFLAVIKHFGVHVSQLVPMGVNREHWFSFKNKTGGRVNKCFKEVTSNLKGWKKRFFLIDRRAVPDTMPRRHTDTDLHDDFSTHYNENNATRLAELIIPLRPPPHHLLYVCRLTTTCRHPDRAYNIKDHDGNVIDMDTFLKLLGGSEAPRKKRKVRKNPEPDHSGFERTLSATHLHHAALKNAGDPLTVVSNEAVGAALNVEREVVKLSGNTRMTTPPAIVNQPPPHLEHHDSHEHTAFD
nr:retinoblastoma-related protein [Tanacetum cinerariifolium]